MKIDSSIWELNKNRYPRYDLFVIVTVDQCLVKYLATDDLKDAEFIPDSMSALVFDGFNLANKLFVDMGFDLVHGHYIVPIGAIQILTGVTGGISTHHTVIRESDNE